MTLLSEPQKAAIVQYLACFKRPSEVVVLLREEFGIEITIRQVVGYDPTRSSFDAAERWREIFYAQRKAFIEDVYSVPIAHKGYRLRKLQELLDKAVGAGDIRQALRTLDMAAREANEVMTWQSQQHAQSRWSTSNDMTPQERKEATMQVLREALQRAVDDARSEIALSPASSLTPGDAVGVQRSICG